MNTKEYKCSSKMRSLRKGVYRREKKAMYCSNKCKKKMENSGCNFRKRKKGMSITEIAVAARKAGMTYGQYVEKMGL